MWQSSPLLPSKKVVRTLLKVKWFFYEKGITESKEENYMGE